MSSDVQLDGFLLLQAGCELRLTDDVGASLAADCIVQKYQIKIPGYPYWRDVNLGIPTNQTDATLIHFSMAGNFREFLRVWCRVNKIPYEEY